MNADKNDQVSALLNAAVTWVGKPTISPDVPPAASSPLHDAKSRVETIESEVQNGNYGVAREYARIAQTSLDEVASVNDSDWENTAYYANLFETPQNAPSLRRAGVDNVREALEQLEPILNELSERPQ